MLLHHRAAQAEAEPHAVGPRGEKRREETARHLFADTAAEVGHDRDVLESHYLGRAAVATA